MRSAVASLLLLALSLAPGGTRGAERSGHPPPEQPRQPRKCFQIRGRAILYRGDGFFAIWHVGTHHIFYPVGDKSWDLLCSYMDCKSPRKQPALFADMTVCPTEPYKKGWAQPAVVKRVTHSYVVPDWSPGSSK
jgi:hypothetical protein